MSMNDRDRLRALLTDFGAHFVDEGPHEGWPGDQANPPWPRPGDPQIVPARITIPSEGGPKNTGYSGFICVFSFDDDGKFVDVSVEV